MLGRNSKPDIARWVFETHSRTARQAKTLHRQGNTADSDAALIQQLRLKSARTGRTKTLPPLRPPPAVPVSITTLYAVMRRKCRENPHPLKPRPKYGPNRDLAPKAKTQSEHDLYPILSDYLRIESCTASGLMKSARAIAAVPTATSGHPDVVIEDLTATWQPEVKTSSGSIRPLKPDCGRSRLNPP